MLNKYKIEYSHILALFLLLLLTVFLSVNVADAGSYSGSKLVKSIKWEKVIINQGPEEFNNFIDTQISKLSGKRISFLVRLPSGDYVTYNRYPSIASVELTGQRYNYSQPKIGSKEEPVTIYYQDIRYGGVINRTAVCKMNTCLDITPGLLNIPGVAYKSIPFNKLFGYDILNFTPFSDLVVSDMNLLLMSKITNLNNIYKVSSLGSVKKESIFSIKGEKVVSGIKLECAGYITSEEGFSSSDLPKYFCFSKTSWFESSRYHPYFKVISKKPTKIPTIKVHTQEAAKELHFFGEEYFRNSKVTTFRFAKYLNSEWKLREN